LSDDYVNVLALQIQAGGGVHIREVHVCVYEDFWDVVYFRQQQICEKAVVLLSQVFQPRVRCQVDSHKNK